MPELAGLVAPTVIGSQEKVLDKETGLTVVVRKPIASQVAMAVQRGLKYAALRRTPNRDKRVAIVFYDYPAGKANIGASYLNVAESIAQILQRLQNGRLRRRHRRREDRRRGAEGSGREGAQRRRLRAGRAEGARRSRARPCTSAWPSTSAG